MTPEIADAIVGITLTRGGGTFDSKGALIEREKGFVVGIFRSTWATMAPSDSDLAYDLFNRFFKTFPDAMMGTWYEKGQIYVDPVEFFEDREIAMSVGRKNGQKAIYSFEKGTIYL